MQSERHVRRARNTRIVLMAGRGANAARQQQRLNRFDDSAPRVSGSHAPAPWMSSEVSSLNDVLGATLVALVSVFAFVLGVSGLRRRARKFANSSAKCS